MPAPKKPSSLVLPLQGKPATATTTLFLLPDGTGSAMTYARLPNLSAHASSPVCLCAVNSPALGTGPFAPPDTTIETLATGFLAAIRATQPRGPYHVGGWSAGGFFATEVARQLLDAGEEVAAVVLIDSPCRLEFEALPFEVIAHLFERGLMGGASAAAGAAGGKAGERLQVQPKPMPKWLADHFEGTLRAVEAYAPRRVEGSGPPPVVYVIEASAGVFETREEVEASGFAESGKVTRLLLGPRPSAVQPQGWERVYPRSRVRCARSTGNHFTMVQPPHSESLGALIREILANQDGTPLSGKWTDG